MPRKKTIPIQDASGRITRREINKDNYTWDMGEQA
jgi:hypothetical protein